jgi:hypothetical protein
MKIHTTTTERTGRDSLASFLRCGIPRAKHALGLIRNQTRNTHKVILKSHRYFIRRHFLPLFLSPGVVGSFTMLMLHN